MPLFWIQNIEKQNNFITLLTGLNLQRFPSVGLPAHSGDLHLHENGISLLKHCLFNVPDYIFVVNANNPKPWFETPENLDSRIQRVVQFLNTDPAKQKALENINRNFNKRINMLVDSKGEHLKRWCIYFINQ